MEKGVDTFAKLDETLFTRTMKPTIIKLPNGEAIAASSIIAVRRLDRSVSNPGTEYECNHRDRVIIDYHLHGTLVCECPSPEERDALAARIDAARDILEGDA